jgi:hypothetical protein
MEIDWIIAIGLFLVFVGWSFTYYIGFFSATTGMGTGVLGISGDVINYLEMGTYDVPVSYNSVTNETGVLYMDFIWPIGSKNSTIMFSGSQSLPCYITGNRIYWQSDIIAGKNMFTMRYHTQNTTLNCDSSFSLSNTSQAIPWVAEENVVISQGKIDQMLSMDFRAFAAGLGISQDFRIEIDINGTSTGYGAKPPLGYDVYVKENPGTTENNDNVIVRILSW